jgi:hypothetical protein
MIRDAAFLMDSSRRSGRPLRGYVVVGALTGSIGGFVGVPAGAHNNSRAAAALASVPVTASGGSAGGARTLPA